MAVKSGIDYFPKAKGICKVCADPLLVFLIKIQWNDNHVDQSFLTFVIPVELAG